MADAKRELVMTPIEPANGKPGTVFVEWGLFENAVYKSVSVAPGFIGSEPSYTPIKISDIVDTKKSTRLVPGGHGSSFDKIQYWWYYTNADGLWVVGESGDSQESSLYFEYPDDAKKLKLKIEPIAKQHWAENRKQWTMDAVTSAVVKVSDIKKQAESLKPETPSLSDFSLTQTADGSKIIVGFSVSSTNTKFTKYDIRYENIATGKKKTVTLSNDVASKVARGSITLSRDNEFRFEARIYNSGGVCSAYTEQSGIVYTLPARISSWWMSSYEKNTTEDNIDGITFKFVAPEDVLTRSDLYNGLTIRYRDITAGQTTYEYETKSVSFSSGEDKAKYSSVDGCWSYILTGLEDGHDYGCMIALESSSGQGRWTTEKTVRVGGAPDPKVPSVPQVEIIQYDNKNDKLRCVITHDDANSSYIEYQVYRKKISKTEASNWAFYNSGTDTLSTTESVWTCEIDNPNYIYRVRCRAGKTYSADYVIKHGILNGGVSDVSTSASVSSVSSSFPVESQYEEVSDWCDGWSEEVSPRPSAPSSLKIKMTNQDYRIQASWKLGEGKSYSFIIEYTENPSYFDKSYLVKSHTVNREDATSEIWDIESGGKTWYFRIAARGADGESSQSTWSEITSITVGTQPGVPSIWTYEEVFAASGRPTFYIVHNSLDNSSMRQAEIEVTFRDLASKELIETHTFTYTNTVDPDDPTDEIHKYTPTKEEWSSYYNNDYYIEWRVRTLGAYTKWSNWSAYKMFNICKDPELSVEISSDSIPVEDESIITCEYPINIHLSSKPLTQDPISYYIHIVAREDYTYINNVGVETMVLKGDVLYSEILSPDYDYVLEPYQETIKYPEERVVTKYKRVYTKVTDKHSIHVSILPSDVILKPGKSYTVKAGVSMNSGLTAEASNKFKLYETTDMPIPDGTIVYNGSDYTATVIFSCSDESGDFDPDITLSLYRRDFDGKFVEIASDMPNGIFNTAIDPHPAMDYARYRLVAINNVTGSINYNDIDDLYIGEAGIILQWDEDWVSYSSNSLQSPEESGWSGSLIHLLGNTNISDKYDPDVNLVKYIGRDNPVSYHGTQIGQTSSWSCEVPKEDKETIFALRRLSRYMGNVYVRESSGTGYLATVKVSIGLEANNPSVSVSLDVTRVDAGDTNLGTVGYTNGG